jgi:hypothetical protein
VGIRGGRGVMKRMRGRLREPPYSRGERLILGEEVKLYDI